MEKRNQAINFDGKIKNVNKDWRHLKMDKLERVARLADNTYNPVTKTGTYSIKTSMSGNRLVVKFSTIVNFASESALRPQVTAAREHAIGLIKSFLDTLKKDYKKATEESLKIKDVNSADNIEIIQATSNSPRKVAYYRFNQTVDIL